MRKRRADGANRTWQSPGESNVPGLWALYYVHIHMYVVLTNNIIRGPGINLALHSSPIKQVSVFRVPVPTPTPSEYQYQHQ
jgi:hypothetical protein